MEKRKKQEQKEKMRMEREAMVFRRGKWKKRLRGGKMKNRCMKEDKKEYGMQKINSDFKTGNRKKEKDKRKKGRKENEVENEKREDGKRTREEIS